MSIFLARSVCVQLIYHGECGRQRDEEEEKEEFEGETLGRLQAPLALGSIPVPGR